MIEEATLLGIYITLALCPIIYNYIIARKLIRKHHEARRLVMKHVEDGEELMNGGEAKLEASNPTAASTSLIEPSAYIVASYNMTVPCYVQSGGKDPYIHLVINPADLAKIPYIKNPPSSSKEAEAPGD